MTDRDSQASPPVRYRRTPDGLRFPGCRPVRIPRNRIEDFDGRLEYWEARTETAWIVAEPPGGVHALGAREGTGPQDDPLLRALGAQARAEGQAAGRAEGQAEFVRTMLLERGISVSESFTARAAAVDTPGGAAMAAGALACTGEADFWHRLEGPEH